MTSVLEQQGCRNGPPDNSEDTIVSRFGLHVAAVPDQLALVTDDVSLTYRALDLTASSIATVLRSLPSPRERPIMLFMKGEAARVAAMLGALKANRIFIPVASNAPEKWLTQVIENSGTAHIIADSVYPVDCGTCGHRQRHCHGCRAACSIIGAIRGRSDRLSR